MNFNFKNNKGITLIALIITIIVLLILTSSTISLLLGENGIITQTIRARNSHLQAELEEEIVLFLQDKKIDKVKGEILDYRSEIKEKYPNYSVYYDTDNSIKIYTDSETLLIDQNFGVETIASEDIYKENVAELKASEELKEGDIVYTLGYYTKADNGEAKYIISSEETLVGDNGSIIELNNGLKAVLQIENNTVTVEQFGAYGNGITDDYQYFQKAIESGAKVICLGNKTFLIDQRVVINIDGITLISYGKIKCSSTNELKQNQNQVVFAINNCSDIAMYNFEFYTERTSATSYDPEGLAEIDWKEDWTSSNRMAIVICGGKNVEIKNLYCENFEVDIKMDISMNASESFQPDINKNIKITNHISKNCTQQTILIGSTSDVIIDNANYILATGLGHHYHHIYCTSYSKNITIQNSKFYVQDKLPGVSINFASAYTQEINTDENPQNLIVKNCEFYNLYSIVAAKGNSKCYVENIKVDGESYWVPTNDKADYYFASKQLFRFRQESILEVKNSSIRSHVLLCDVNSKQIKFTNCNITIQNNNILYSNATFEENMEVIFDNCSINIEDHPNNEVKDLNLVYIGSNTANLNLYIKNCNVKVNNSNIQYLFTARNSFSSIIVENTNFVTNHPINNLFYNISSAKEIRLKDCTINGFTQIAGTTDMQYIQQENNVMN